MSKFKRAEGKAVSDYCKLIGMDIHEVEIMPASSMYAFLKEYDLWLERELEREEKQRGKSIND